jgi:hypothetical protein
MGEVAMHKLCVLAVPAILQLVSSTPVQAERSCNVPAGYYRVVDPELEGALRLHEQPSLSSPVLAEIAKGDIVQSDGTRAQGDSFAWQEVKVMQTTGWIKARNLWRTLPLTHEQTEFPTAGWCGDFAPLWSMRWDHERLRLSLFPGRFDLPLTRVGAGASLGSALIAGEGEGVSYRIVFDDRICRNADGHMQGLGAAHLIITRDGREELYSGCCAAAPEAFSKRDTAALAP